MTAQVRLNLYERGIVEELVEHFGYSADGARRLVVQYIAVIRKLGGYDSCRDHAERLVQAQQLNLMPEEWLERIRSIDREAAADKGILHLEHGSQYARVW
ncbi:hypothetical protein K0T92_00030 [Paenibacillus oenotherae]|uniref:Uncharacterized protein n=1 Tax=Paenibacillus oenotherae TaxID=1435645 RepID=A0ABS7CZZ1_9BACL|nr:hypothetical protein [Paenibacillus oenotherae]MBW7473122.1 hypothetical protein [Paenibacillus oenotherae]